MRRRIEGMFRQSLFTEVLAFCKGKQKGETAARPFLGIKVT